MTRRNPSLTLVIRSILILALSIVSACRCNQCVDNGASVKSTGPPKHQPVVSAMKIVLLPIHNSSLFPDASYRFDDALFNALASSRQFDVTRDPNRDQQCITDHTFLADKVKQFQNTAAGVVIGTVEEYEPYPRPRLAVRLEMFRSLDTRRVASITGHFDSADANTSDAIRQFYFALSDSRHPGTTDIVFDSPDMYFRFAAQQMADSLIKTIGNQPASQTTVSLTGPSYR